MIELPQILEVNGTEYQIRSDFRDILNIVIAFGDPDLEDNEKIYICLFVLYVDFDRMPERDYEAAFKAATTFIDCGLNEEGSNGWPSARIMDWEQDAGIMFPAINHVAGFEVRSAEYIHWWTFMGYYMEISEGIFSHILGLRVKKAKGKPLEKWEREYWRENKALCVLNAKLSEEEKAERDRINALLG